MNLEPVEVRCHFDPVSDICLLATTPDGEQHWLAGSSMVKLTDSGSYLIPMFVAKELEMCVFQWQFCPLGKTAIELSPYARKRVAK